MVRIIYIDHDKKWQDILRFSLPDYLMISSYTGKAGINMIKNRYPDVVLLNNMLPDMNGLEVLKKINSLPCPPPVIILGNCEKPQDIVDSIKNGAVDYLSKTCNLKILKSSILQAAYLYPAGGPGEDIGKYPELDSLVGESRELNKLKKDIIPYALSDAAILLRGETGTGKDLIARAIHRISKRREGPYRVIHAGAMPFTLIESQLYGTEKGAYTDAVSRAGCFELSDNGTLFIDEIGEMTLPAQVKLLRILEDNEIVRIGGKSPVPIDVRIISATNIDIQNALKRKMFRIDLFFRISTLTLFIPPLRERKDDIPLLVNHFLKQAHYKSSISRAALIKMLEYSWPGNVRELKNVLNRAMVLSQNQKIEQSAIVPDVL